MRGRRRICIALLAVSVLMFGCPKIQVYAALPGSISTETGMITYGILVVENQQRAGSVELEYNNHKEVITCDYSEYEVPMHVEGSLKITAGEGYSVSAVTAEERELTSKDGVYYFCMDREILTLTVKYTEDSKSKAEADDSKPSKEEEWVSNETSKDTNKSSNPSVSAITYDVEVTYLNEEADPSESVDITPESSEETEVVAVPKQELPEDVVQKENLVVEEEKDSKDYETGSEEKKTSDETKKSKKKSQETPSNENTETKDTTSKAGTSERVSEEEGKTATAQQKALVIFPNLSLYIVTICCIIAIKKCFKLDKKG